MLAIRSFSWIAAAGLPLALGCGDERVQSDAGLPDGGARDGGADAPLDAPPPLDGDADALLSGDGAACDPTESPHDEPCLLADAYGVFVSADDSPGGDGSRSRPLPSIAQGIEAASVQGLPRVFVCQGQYEESVILDTAHSNISLYGGFDCATWTLASKPVPTAVQSPTPAFALRVDQVARPVSVEDFSFTAPDDFQGSGSLAALIHISTVTFRRVALLSGQGARGSDGAGGILSPNYISPVAPSGLTGSSDAAGLGGAAQCLLSGSSQGGQGGSYSLGTLTALFRVLIPGTSGTAMPPVMATPPHDGAAGCPSCVSAEGDPGASGAPGTSGLAPNFLVPNLPPSGWSPQVGATGPFGNPGQGGGGGQASCAATPCPTLDAAYGGNGGGAGGCGGSPGTGGAEGSPSIALVSLQSSVAFFDSTLTTSSGGDGGNGGDGQDGQGGGASSARTPPKGFAGGPGGAGAGGGGGTGGNGGASLAVFYRGAKPTLNNTPISVGAPGKGGAGGMGGAGPGQAGPSGNPGGPGLSNTIFGG